jgi:hypothetical protein
MSDEQIENDSSQVDEKDQIPTSQDQADPAVSANSKTDTTQSSDDVRERLVQELLQSPVEETETPAAEPEVTDTDDEDDEADVASEVKSEEKPKDEAQELAENENLGARTKRVITTLRQKAAFGDLITTTLTDAGIKPEEFANWTNLAARLKKGDLTAVNELVATAKAFGYKEPTIVQEKPKTIDDVAEEIYKAEFAAEVQDLNISESLARKQSRKLAEVKAKEVPEETRRQPETKQQPVENVNPIRDHALKAINDLESKFKTSVADYDKLAPKIVERLRSEYGNSDPIYWVAGYQTIVNEEIRKSKPAPAPQKAPIKPVAGTQIRPTAVAAPAAKTGNTRDDLVNRLLKEL